MARGVYSNSNHFIYTGVLVTAAPVSISMWVNPSAASAAQGLGGIFKNDGAGTDTDGWGLFLSNTTGVLNAVSGTGAASTVSTSAAGLTAEVWNHCGGVFAAVNSRYAYLNGVQATQNTTSRTPSTPTIASIGVRKTQANGNSSATLCMIAEVGFWNVALTAADMLQLAAGYSPLFVKPESLVAYYPLIRGDASGDEPDLMGGLTMVEQGTVAVAAHSRVFYPASPVKLWVKIPAGGATNITAAQNFQAQKSDAATLGVITPITPAEGNQAQVSDAASITAQGPTYTITVADGTQAQVSDAASLGVIAPITPSEGKQAQVSDAATFGVIAPIAPAQNFQAQVSDAAPISAQGPTFTITVADATQAQVSDAALLGVWTPITPAEAHQAQASDTAVLTAAIVATLILHGNRQLYQVGARSTYSVNRRDTGEVDD